MQQVKLAVKEADNKLAAYLNARERSAQAQKEYSAAAQQRASKLFEAVRTTYIRSKCYLTYRNNFVAIKVCKPTQADKLNAAAVEELLASVNAVKAVTKQGIIYRLAV